MAEIRKKPLVVGVGGTLRRDSSSERALRAAMSEVTAIGGDVKMFFGADINFDSFAPEAGEAGKHASFIQALREADGIVISSPAYHGLMSGLIKNAFDYVELMRSDERPYLDGRAVGCIVCASGAQAGVTTLASLRSMAHALRGWPTPFGAFVLSGSTATPPQIKPRDAEAQAALVARQVMDFCLNWNRYQSASLQPRSALTSAV